MGKSTKEKETELEHCVLCGNETAYTKGTLISERTGYLEGAGQLCYDCHEKLYLKGQGWHG